MKILKEELDEIFENTIPHSAFLSKSAIDSCMYQAYMLGKEKEIEKYKQLKKTFLSLLEDWGDFGNYNSDRNQMEEEWKKEAGLL